MPLFHQLYQDLKSLKLVVVLSTSILVTDSLEALLHVPCIWYLVMFGKKQPNVRALLDFRSEVNAMIRVYEDKLSLTSQSTNVRSSKIYSSLLEINRIVIVELLVYDKLGRACFFEETFC